MTKYTSLNTLGIDLSATHFSLLNNLLSIDSYINITLLSVCLAILALPKMSVFVTHKRGSDFCSVLQRQRLPDAPLGRNGHDYQDCHQQRP